MAESHIDRVGNAAKGSMVRGSATLPEWEKFAVGTDRQRLAVRKGTATWDGDQLELVRMDFGDTNTYDPASIAAQTIIKANLGVSNIANWHSAPVAPAALEADLAPFGVTQNKSLAGLHAIAAVDGASRRWRVRMFNIDDNYWGLWHSSQDDYAVDPPSVAAQTMWTTTIALGAKSNWATGDDLWLPGAPTDLEADLVPVPPYLSGTALRISLHTVAAVDGAARTWRPAAMRAPAIEASFDLDPPSIAAQTCAKINVALPAGSVSPGDLVTLIPPTGLHADLIYCGNYVSAADEIKVTLHTVAAIDDASRTWKVVVWPGRLVV